MHFPATARTLPAAVLALALTGALGGVATAPAQAAAAAPSPCGTKVSDYTGTALADSAFTGKISLAQDGLPDRDITLTPVNPNSTLVNIEIKISPTEVTSATGNFTLRVNPINQGGITFPTYAGPLGQTTSVACNLTSRVVAMTGRISTTGIKGDRVFTVTR